MCGRFTLVRIEDFLRELQWVLPLEGGLLPRYNIAPSQPIAAIVNRPEPHVAMLQWGLIPAWAKDPAIGNRLINARAESLAEKPAFRGALRHHRCLIPADGFYEWKKGGSGARIPHLLRLKSRKVFALAGLWDMWQSPDGSELCTCTIITTRPNALAASIHDRMPLIVRPADYRRWVSPGEQSAGALADIFEPYPAEEMEAVPVSRLVNSPANDTPECAAPIEMPEDSAPVSVPRRKRGESSGQGSLFE